jgi:hypothetical protein
LFDYCDHEQIYKMFKNFYNGSLELTISDIQRLDFNKVKVAPCNVENSMKKHYKNYNDAFNDLISLTENGIKVFNSF